MARVFRSAYDRTKNFMNRTTTMSQVLPPYLLIGLLWWIGVESDARERSEERVEAAINIAEIRYITDLQLAAQKADLRQDCIDDVSGRNNNIENWLNLFEFLRNEPGAQEFAARLEFDFSNRSRNRKLDIESYCIDFPEPEPVEVPGILVQEGIVPPP